jgi:RNA-dependent RNA polymerase
LTAQEESVVRGGGITVKTVCQADVNLLREPLFFSLRTSLFRYDTGRIHRKVNMPVERGATLLGVPDETRSLEYGEVYIRLSERAECGGERTALVTGAVAVTKNPCLHPGDVLRLRAVPRPALDHIVDCVVFPVKGPRPHPDEISGSDLDGDMFFCTWDPDLIPPDPVDFMDFTPGDAASDNPSAGARPATPSLPRRRRR